MGRPTLVSLAQELGVSRQTVSNVINAPHLVRPETRERVQAAIEASGYRPNVAAQALRNRRSLTLALRVYPTVDGGINGAMMDRFVRHSVVVAQRLGYRVMLVSADSFGHEVDVMTELSVRGTIDGCVLTDAHADDERQAALADAGLPCVTFGRDWDQTNPNATYVDVDGAAGTRLATRHLLEQGHTRIGFLGWPEGSEVGEDRRRGWREAMTEAGIGGIEDWQFGGLDRLESGLTGMEQLLARDVTAAVCASDSLAIGAAEALRRSGRELTPELGVVGFDNTPVARALGLSSIDQPVEEAATQLCEQLVAVIQDPERDAGGLTLLEPRLVVRELGSIFVERG